jgi:glycosyltransferase involved in cell wall biosynthesis
METTALLNVPAIGSDAQRSTATVDIVIPVHNEEAGLEQSVRRLHSYLEHRFPLRTSITIADNASTDATWGIASRLANELPDVAALHLDEKGRGRALRIAWTASPSPIVVYMDVDLSTDLDALLPLVAPLVSGHSDVAIGTRLAPSSRVVRGAKREVISRAYNLLLRTSLHSGFSDAQCGFKAMRTDIARALLPSVQDQGWFFDTELLVLAERNGLRIHEVPVDWVDDPDSRVDIVRTARADLLGVVRMLRTARRSTVDDDHVAPRHAAPASLVDQLARFASIGLVSTLVFGALLAVLSGPLGLIVADLVALSVCSVANTAANRRLTFMVRGSGRAHRQAGEGAALAALPMLTTLVAIALTGGTPPAARLVLIVLAGGVSALARFTLMRGWASR